MNPAVNGPRLDSPASPADRVSVMGQNMCLDEEADTDAAAGKPEREGE